MATSPTAEGAGSLGSALLGRSNTGRMLFREDDSPSPSPKKQSLEDALTKNHDSGLQVSTAGDVSDHDDSDEGSDLEVRRPVGRAARRMLGGGAASPSQRSAGSLDDELYSATPLRPAPSKGTPIPPSTTRSGLFVSPAQSRQDDSDDDLPTNPLANSKLAALVAEKRKARLAQEAAEDQEREERLSAHRGSDLPDELLEGSQEEVNDDVERIMSDAARPTRKASKKALLEMERETQRLARQQALAHQMKVKRKFTTSDLFARFNYHPDGVLSGPSLPEEQQTPSSVPNSDAAESVQKEPVSTPPSSPPTPLDRQRALVDQGVLSKLVPVREDSLTTLAELDMDDEEMLDMADILRSSSRTISKKESGEASSPSFEKKGLKLARLGKKAMVVEEDNSEDDLEILEGLPRHLILLEKAKGVQQHRYSKAIHTLKHLAHIGADAAPSRRQKRTAKPSVNPKVLEAQLRLRAKEQARAEQLQRIADLKAKGIEVQTAEEREREQEQYEDLLEKARQEAVELRKAEKAAAREARGDESKAVASDDESEDGDYTDESEEENEQDEDATGESGSLVDEEVGESEEEEDNTDHEALDDQDQDQIAAAQLTVDDHAEQAEPVELPCEASPTATSTPMARQRPRKSHVVVDEDDESDVEAPQASAHEPAENDDDPFAAFGFGVANPASSLMSPTQAFNATMQTPTQATQQQDSMDVLNYLALPPSSSLPPVAMHMDSQIQEGSQSSIVPGSQAPESQQINLLWETQAPDTPVPGLNRENSNTTLETPGWQPTQDDGLPSPWQTAPRLRRESTLDTIAEQVTQSTVRVRISESPPARPARKRLVRGQKTSVDSSDDESKEPAAQPKAIAKKNAFQEMARKRKEAMTEAEREQVEREMREMMEEQAEESEDEYAGLGGDDFVAPETEQDHEIIDSSHVDVDERQLAALYAERQRADDEAEAQKLYKDITTGGLRRKQANMFDLDEDEEDLAVRRRQMRQREEARKRKLLLQDDNIAGLAEGKHSKGKDAFLKAIADDDERDDDVLDLSERSEDEAPASQMDSQQSQEGEATSKPLREISGNKRRSEHESADRPPAKARRTQASAFRAPTSLAEVRESVSFLLDEPHAPMVGPTVLEQESESGSEEESTHESAANERDSVREELARQNDGGYAPDRVAMPPPRFPASQRRTAAKTAVVDRLSLKRSASASDSTNGRTAWAASTSGGFKVPSLLRRATTNTALNANERGVSTSNGFSREAGVVKVGGSKKSSLAYQARAEERSKIVEASAKRRDENRARIAQLRRNASSGFGKEMGGRFE